MNNTKLDYSGLNTVVLNSIPPTAKRILDLGCGTGALGKWIKARQACNISGITYSESEAHKAREVLDTVLVRNLDSFSVDGLPEFDCIVCSHVLEHLLWPEELLKLLKSRLSPSGQLIVAVPNVLVWHSRIKLALGRFRYTDGGIMDRTHFRFFDWRSAQTLVSGAGYRITSAIADGGLPRSRYLWRGKRFADSLATRLAPGIFGWQFVITAENQS